MVKQTWCNTCQDYMPCEHVPEVNSTEPDWLDEVLEGVMEELDFGTIGPNEHHPAADSAMAWLKGYMVQHSKEYLLAKEALASTALSGNRNAEICMSTIERIRDGKPVSDRYLLGLAWTIMELANYTTLAETASFRIDNLRETQGGSEQ